LVFDKATATINNK